MKQQIKPESNTQPYWPTLKLILSSFIVFNFYLNLADKNKVWLLIDIFNLTLIPMFVFIVAFVTKNTTWKSLKLSLLPSFIIYLTFQTVDAIPLYFSDQLSLKLYILEPQNGVWFFLAIPVWQAFFLLLPPKLKFNNLILFFILIASLILSYLTNNHLMNLSKFFSIIIYFPFFIMAYFINNEKISLLRKKSFLMILITTTLAISVLYHEESINRVIINFTNATFLSSFFVIYILKFFISIVLGSSIIYFALSTDKYAKVSNNALGIYLIHPIICFIFLQTLTYFHVEYSLLVIILLTLSTISICLLLTLNSTIRWFIEPKLNFNKLIR
ncbi:MULTISPECIES: acetyltransferase [Enterobacterales]|uniref:acetyltransferase n=1 Tax=Enterobacterales TaxID=91347 RepID=UPI0008480C0F|nr:MULTISPECIES: acetyltransferase [Enterobacterales]ODQ04792.1 acetyltransferase [Shigella sp. FC130]OEI92327.1 acetyltransferase [Shigella sp. FC1655]WOO51313.1 acetyltransferase [Hafnia alvei]WPF05786.1 acetyltransferase [Proteus vulgaris]